MRDWLRITSDFLNDSTNSIKQYINQRFILACCQSAFEFFSFFDQGGIG